MRLSMTSVCCLTRTLQCGIAAWSLPEDLSLLLEEWRELLEPVRRLSPGAEFPGAGQLHFRGAVLRVYRAGPGTSNAQGGTLWFVGNMKEGAFSDSVAEDYNIKSAELAEAAESGKKTQPVSN